MKKRKLNLYDPNAKANRTNWLTYLDYFNRMKKICLSMFEWVNLPESMDARWLEMSLFNNGQAALLKTKEYGYINTNATAGNNLNIYGIPTILNCYSLNFNRMRKTYQGFNKKMRDTDEAILVMNNWDKVPTVSTLELFATRLADAERVADINIAAQKTPIAIQTTPEMEYTVKNAYAQYDGNVPVIFGVKGTFSPEDIKPLESVAPYVADKVKDYQVRIWNEFLTFIGVMNMEEKKERRVVNEGESKNEVINLNLESFLAPRKHACKQFNEKYGLNIDVKVRSDLHNIVKETMTTNLNTLEVPTNE